MDFLIESAIKMEDMAFYFRTVYPGLSGYLPKILYFVSQVKSGATLDIKLQAKWQYPYGKTLNEKIFTEWMYYNGRYWSAEQLGNFAFGY